MPKLSNKSIGLCGATLLIIFDVFMIGSCLKLRGVDFFNQVIYNMLPCGLLLGAFAFCVLLKKIAARKLGIVAMIVFGIAAIARLIVGIFAVKLIIVNSNGASAMDSLTDEALVLIEFFAFTLLIIAAIFLVIYALYDKFKKTTQVIAGVSLIALTGVCVVNIYQLVSLGTYNGQSMLQIYWDIFENGYVGDILLVIGYALAFGSLTGAMESKKE